MRGSLIALAIFAVLLPIGIVSYRIAFPTIHVRYRLTVEVQDGDAMKSGSGVIEVMYNIQPDSFVNLGGFNAYPRRIGSAITVDLDKNGLLFLTFQSAKRTQAQQIERNKQVSC